MAAEVVLGVGRLGMAASDASAGPPARAALTCMHAASWLQPLPRALVLLPSRRCARRRSHRRRRWLAPEVLSGHPGQLPADVWAFGTVRAAAELCAWPRPPLRPASAAAVGGSCAHRRLGG